MMLKVTAFLAFVATLVRSDNTSGAPDYWNETYAGSCYGVISNHYNIKYNSSTYSYNQTALAQGTQFQSQYSKETFYDLQAVAYFYGRATQLMMERVASQNASSSGNAMTVFLDTPGYMTAYDVGQFCYGWYQDEGWASNLCDYPGTYVWQWAQYAAGSDLQDFQGSPIKRTINCRPNLDGSGRATPSGSSDMGCDVAAMVYGQLKNNAVRTTFSVYNPDNGVKLADCNLLSDPNFYSLCPVGSYGGNNWDDCTPTYGKPTMI